MQALVRTLWMSGAYAGFENVVAMLYIFGAHVPLFLCACAHASCWPSQLSSPQLCSSASLCELCCNDAS